MIEGSRLPEKLPLLVVSPEEHYIEVGKQAAKELDELSILRGKLNIAKSHDIKATVDAHDYMAARTILLTKAEQYAENGSTAEVRNHALAILTELKQEPGDIS